eukprot:5274210-Alexandrium_andersonii.AAC.1
MDGAPLWDSLRRELMALVALRPLLFARLDRGWAEHALTTDASYMGVGVLITRAEPAELRAEAPWAAASHFFEIEQA